MTGSRLAALLVIAALAVGLTWVIVLPERDQHEAGTAVPAPLPKLGPGTSLPDAPPEEVQPLAAPAPSQVVQGLPLPETPTEPAAQHVPAASALSVEVFDPVAGAPVSGARVRVVTADVQSGQVLDRQDSVSNSSGVSGFDIVHGDLEIVARDEPDRIGHLSRAAGGWDSGDRIRVELQAVGTVRGVVRADDGRALSDVEVSSNSWQGAGLPDVFTDGSGHFEFPYWVLGRGSMLRFEKAGFGEEKLLLIYDLSKGWYVFDEGLDLNWHPGEPFLEVTLLEQKSMTGFVVDSAGRPVPDATVQAKGRIGAGLGVYVSDEASVLTGDDGAFLIEGLHLDALHLVSCEVQGVGSAAAWARIGILRNDLGVLRLQPDCLVVGTVVDRWGVPASGIKVELAVREMDLAKEPLDDSGEVLEVLIPKHERETYVLSDGRFGVLSPPSGSAKLSVRLGPHIVLRHTFELDPAGSDLGELRLEVELRRVIGTLLEATGNPVIGQDLEVYALSSRAWTHVTTDTAGEFSFTTTRDVATPMTVSLAPSAERPAQQWEIGVDEETPVLRLEVVAEEGFDGR